MRSRFIGSMSDVKQAYAMSRSPPSYSCGIRVKLTRDDARAVDATASAGGARRSHGQRRGLDARNPARARGARPRRLRDHLRPRRQPCAPPRARRHSVQGTRSRRVFEPRSANGCPSTVRAGPPSAAPPPRRRPVHLFPSIVLGRIAGWLADVPVRFSMIPGPVLPGGADSGRD